MTLSKLGSYPPLFHIRAVKSSPKRLSILLTFALALGCKSEVEGDVYRSGPAGALRAAASPVFVIRDTGVTNRVLGRLCDQRRPFADSLMNRESTIPVDVAESERSIAEMQGKPTFPYITKIDSLKADRAHALSSSDSLQLSALRMAVMTLAVGNDTATTDVNGHYRVNASKGSLLVALQALPGGAVAVWHGWSPGSGRLDLNRPEIGRGWFCSISPVRWETSARETSDE